MYLINTCTIERLVLSVEAISPSDVSSISSSYFEADGNPSAAGLSELIKSISVPMITDTTDAVKKIAASELLNK